MTATASTPSSNPASTEPSTDPATRFPASVNFPSRNPRYTLFSPDRDDYILGRVAIMDDFYEASLLRIAAVLPLAPGIVIDGGANVGNHSLFFATQMQRRVVAFEPSAVIADALEAGVRANGLANKVTVIKAGLSDAPGEARLVRTSPNLGMSHILGDDPDPDAVDGEVEGVRLTTIDDALAGSKERVAMIKLDVEGFEIKALMGARKTLKAHQPVVVIEAHTAFVVNTANDFFSARGYELLAMAGRSRNMFFCPAAKAPAMRRAADEQRRFEAARLRDGAAPAHAVDALDRNAEIDRLRRSALSQAERALRAERKAVQLEAELAALGKRAKVPDQEARKRDLQTFKTKVSELEQDALLMQETIEAQRRRINEISLRYRAESKALMDVRAELNALKSQLNEKAMERSLLEDAGKLEATPTKAAVVQPEPVADSATEQADPSSPKSKSSKSKAAKPKSAKPTAGKGAARADASRSAPDTPPPS